MRQPGAVAKIPDGPSSAATRTRCPIRYLAAQDERDVVLAAEHVAALPIW